MTADVWRALAHLRAAQRLLRGVYALDVLVHVNRGIRAAENRLKVHSYAQPPLTFEAADDAAPPA